MNTLKVLLLALGLGLTACGGVGQSARTISESSVAAIGCKVSQSEMWGALHRVAEDEQEFPSATDVAEALREVGQSKQLSGPAFENFVKAFGAHYQVVIEGAKHTFAPASVGGWKKALAELEVGLRTTEAHAKLNDQVVKTLSDLEAAEAALNKSCDLDDKEISEPAAETISLRATIWEQLKSAREPELFGLNATFATAYQSCDVLREKPMTRATPAVQGIEVVGRHPAGGLRRKIASLAKVNATHPYIAGQRLAQNSCFELRESPLIYDFGGKPFTRASEPQILDMFRNGGSGESVLGIDCSAFVFSALAVAGLRMDPNPKKVLKADLVHGIGSRALKEPQDNGLRCLQKISVTAQSSLKNGDIVAINGHVVMLEDVGADPFGLNHITDASQCVAAKINPDRFRFTIAQSSPSKGGVGINRYEAKGYLAESNTYREGMIRYAVAACRAKFGLEPKLNSPDLSVVRHRKTPECLDKPLELARFSCVSSCPAP